ncbi:hypothetical protein KSZ_78380 [Dictyobacter formicarum]|uniref:ROK family protein n=2 Tax=Dictyobacter formicarum TaxID=2778368 RepID=A0ABQ3VU79_9CHLR|nr:hypothetical protein KSZ_78380 [Dictyobacter formicarum]
MELCLTPPTTWLWYCSVMNFYNPDSIILGGGVIEAVDLLFETAVARARKVRFRFRLRKHQLCARNWAISRCRGGCGSGSDFHGYAINSKQ